MKPKVELTEDLQTLSLHSKAPCVRKFASLIARDASLLGSLAHLHFQNRPDTVQQMFGAIISQSSLCASEAQQLGRELDRYFGADYPVPNVVGLILETIVAQHLSQRLGAGLKRDVKVHINGRCLEPKNKNLDFGYVDSHDEGGAEFYECKVTAYDLFEVFDGQLALLTQVNCVLRKMKWDVTCGVPTFITQNSAEMLFKNRGVLSWLAPISYTNLHRLEEGKPPF